MRSWLFILLFGPAAILTQHHILKWGDSSRGWGGGAHDWGGPPFPLIQAKDYPKYGKPDIHPNLKWSWQDGEQWKHLTLDLNPTSNKLFPNPRGLGPSHGSIWKNLIKNLVNAQGWLDRFSDSTCNKLNESIARWEFLRQNFDPNGEKLLRAHYFDAIQALGDAAVAFDTTCRIPSFKIPIVSDLFFEITADYLLVLGLLYDSQGWDSMPRWLNGLPHDNFNKLIEASELDVTRPFVVRWQGVMV